MVELTGNAPIYGSVNSTGGVSATGSSPVYGDINATGEVALEGGGVKVYGNVSTAGDVNFESSAEVHGNVSANGNIAFENWGARVTGNARAGGTITSKNKNKPPAQHVGGSVQAASNPGNSGVQQTPCDPLDVDGIVSEFDSEFSTGGMNIGPWTYRDLKLSPDGVAYYDPTWNVQSWKTDNTRTMQDVELFGQETRFLKVSDFALGQNGSLEITGGDVVLMVDGNMSIGGNTEITIAPGSSLTVLLTGRFDLQGSVTVNDRNPIDDSGKLPFSLFSSYEQTSKKGNSDGVQMRGNTDFTAVVYAPKSHVSVSGSGALYGQVRGKSVEATGAGGIHYDIALGAFSVPTSEDAGGNDEATFRVTSWNVVLPE
jgi:cytoskeletal protein CcmA (bactofilin family)